MTSIEIVLIIPEGSRFDKHTRRKTDLFSNATRCDGATILRTASRPDKKVFVVKFLVDAMLGRLTKWLRLLGYDTAWAGHLEDGQIARLARREGRVVLTRDTQFARRKGLQIVLLHSQTLTGQLEELRDRVALPPADLFSRCPVCNTVLQPLGRAAAKPLVPPYVWQTQPSFRRCPGCGRVYWAGTHRQHIFTFLQEIGWPLAKSPTPGETNEHQMVSDASPTGGFGAGRSAFSQKRQTRPGGNGR